MKNWYWPHWSVVAMFVFIVAYDVMVALTGHPTISKLLLDWSIEYPYINSFFSFLMGHLFWPQYRVKYVYVKD